ncbi:MAG: cell wall-binding repeat-containing protein [Desulfosporosinus sp.]
MRKITIIILSIFLLMSQIPLPVLAESSSGTAYTRLAGTDRYQTAINISQAGWATAPNVVLSRGDDFPDALAGAVLAKKLEAPLLLTGSLALESDVQTEIRRLGANHVYLLGSRAALSETIEKELDSLHVQWSRIEGSNRYTTAAEIARSTGAPTGEAFLVTGNGFADALSVSSYAAAHNIPLLMTEFGVLPQVTMDIIIALHINKITIIGSAAVVNSDVETTLKSDPRGFTVNRISDSNRYLTNLKVIQTLDFDRNGAYFATGEDFPDALAGAALAAKRGQPIFLVEKKNVDPQMLSYLSGIRASLRQVSFLGSYNVIPYGTESILRTGSLKPRTSLQYWQGYGYKNHLDNLSMIPSNATDYVDLISPSWYSLNSIPVDQTSADGTFTGSFGSDMTSYTQLVKAAQSRGLKVLPLIASPWDNTGKAALDSVLTNQTSRDNLVNNLVSMVQTTGSDGVVVDFEYMSDATGPFLTQFMQALYANLHAQNKLVVIAVMSRTSSKDWYPEFNYHALAQSCDFLHIMTYDFGMSAPGPIAPLSWVKKVLDYTLSQNLDMNKVLLGIPYYGRDWTRTGTDSYSNKSTDLTGALGLAATYQATVQRETSSNDTVGIPYFFYTDNDQAEHKVYFEDPASWEAKLSLLSQYNLGGIGSWSLFWVKTETAGKLFPLLNKYLR